MAYLSQFCITKRRNICTGYMSVRKMKSKKQVPKETSIYMRFLYHDKGVKGNELLKAFPNYSKATIYRHAKLPFDENHPFDKRKLNKGRPRKLTVRDERNLVRQLRIYRETMGSFGASTLRTAADISPNVSLWAIRRALRRHGYLYSQSRKKGLMTRRDLTRRYRFACKIKRLLPNNFWKEGISFYFDGTSFVHKTNPFDQARATKSMAWRKRGEGLALNCTSKGRKAGVEGKTAHFFVSIAYGKGVISCDQYFERLTGENFAEYVRAHFPRIFEKSANPTAKRFVQDGDPCQNSAVASRALKQVGACKFSIPPRSPDLNPIENLFHLVSKQLEKDALDMHITHETFTQFSERVKRTMLNFPKDIIDNIIESMDKRVAMVLKKRGERLRY